MSALSAVLAGVTAAWPAARALLTHDSLAVTLDGRTAIVETFGRSTLHVTDLDTCGTTAVATPSAAVRAVAVVLGGRS